jgi:hypothetical protein
MAVYQTALASQPNLEIGTGRSKQGSIDALIACHLSMPLAICCAQAGSSPLNKGGRIARLKLDFCGRLNDERKGSLFCARREAAIATKRTCRVALHMSTFGVKQTWRNH